MRRSGFPGLAVIACLVLGGCAAGEAGDTAGPGDAIGDTADLGTGDDAAGEASPDAGDVVPDGADLADVPPDAPQDASADAADVTVAPEAICGTASAVFPAFDRACIDDAGCTLVYHQTDCCGTRVAWGISYDRKDPFAAAEQVCESQYPGCGCPAKATVAEDGAAETDALKFVVACTGGKCASSVGDPCAAVQELEAAKACATDQDCWLVYHQTDCAGTLVAWGIQKTRAAEFLSAENACRSHYPACAKDQGPTRAEDGNVESGPGSIFASCKAGSCTSWVLGVLPSEDAVADAPDAVDDTAADTSTCTQQACEPCTCECPAGTVHDQACMIICPGDPLPNLCPARCAQVCAGAGDVPDAPSAGSDG